MAAAIAEALGVPLKLVPYANPYAWLKDFVEASKANGLVASFIKKFGVQGRLSVAPPA